MQCNEHNKHTFQVMSCYMLLHHVTWIYLGHLRSSWKLEILESRLTEAEAEVAKTS
jgi:hypothetical protein